jgi:hypothetical protein
MSEQYHPEYLRGDRLLDALDHAANQVEHWQRLAERYLEQAVTEGLIVPQEAGIAE